MARPRARHWAFPSAALLLALAACSGEVDDPSASETEVPKNLATFEPPASVEDAGIGTPPEQRVAIIGLLNKRNNLTQDVEIKPGESKRVGDVILRLSACERTPPWEVPPETGAFIQVLVGERASPGAQPKWMQIFSGWLFKNKPSLNVVEHPIYDVWVKACAMNFPGEEAKPAPAASAKSAPKASGSASPDSAPSPSASPAPAAPDSAGTA